MTEPQGIRPGIAERVGLLWCGLMHSSPMWPVRGRYRCRTCGRSYAVPWAGEDTGRPVRLAIRRKESVAGGGA